MKKLLLVANVAKEHVLKFHVPTIKALVDDGWTVDVACGGKEEVPYCHKQYELPIDRSPFNTHFIKAIRQLRRLIEIEEYDIVYCHTEVGGIVARLAASKSRKKGTKVVKLDHGLYFFKGASVWNWLVHYPIDKWLSFKTDTFILINQEDYDLVHNRFKTCQSYLINGIGVDFSKFPTIEHCVREQYRNVLNIPQDAFVMIYLAEISENKNQRYLLNGLKAIMAEDKNVYLVLAGRDLMDGQLERYAEQLGIIEHIRFLGWRNDVRNLYAMSNICTASSIREGFGINIVEAMYCGVPVVATNNRGHSTIIQDGENGLLVDLHNVNSFIDAVRKLKESSEEANRMALNASKEIQKYSSEEITTELVKLLNNEVL